MARKKINQSDLRRLMKERSENVAKEEKVESPLAKYDKFGKLSCIACCEEVKIPWRHHILSRTHKENINKRLKRKNQVSDEVPDNVSKVKYQILSTETSQISINGKSQNHDDDVGIVLSKVSSTPPVIPQDKKNTGLIAGYSSSSEDEEEGEDNHNGANESSSNFETQDIASVLPPGFFDASSSQIATSSPSVAAPAHMPEVKAEANSSTATNPEGLPEGFFDDPILDAKARKVEYKDPMEEEWEMFQKTIAEETNVSQNIMEEDFVKSEAERDIDQIDQMIFSWQKVNELQSKAEDLQHQLQSKKMEVDNEDNTDSSIEEDDLEYLLDWRAKSASKK